MADGGKRDVAVLGLGLMGSALTRRLLAVREEGLVKELGDVLVWNRTVKKAEAFAAEGVRVFETVAGLFEGTKPDSLIICMFASYDQTREVLLGSDRMRELVKGRYVSSLCSGTPDEARQFAGELAEAGVALYLDGCYAGSPFVFQAGKGVLMVSLSDATHAEAADDSFTRRLAATLGARVVFTSRMGANKALDYAIVDFYYANYICLLSGLSMLDSEEVPAEELFGLLDVRLPTFPDQFRKTMAKMDKREYQENKDATLATYKSFFEGRLEYLKANGLSQRMPRMYADLCADAAATPGGSLDDDYTRVQEVLRYNN
mmetsp:Transcript_12560/g.35478  ORF Transcript_12560/g.35478 Transcript_12560/m.35478 type:complete len:317 (-) Transcript_12560:213-1163(-)